MSFFTALTPSTLRAAATAVVAAAGELTNPLTRTTPLNVSTSIWVDFSVGSLTPVRTGL